MELLFNRSSSPPSRKSVNFVSDRDGTTDKYESRDGRVRAKAAARYRSKMSSRRGRDWTPSGAMEVSEATADPRPDTDEAYGSIRKFVADLTRGPVMENFRLVQVAERSGNGLKTSNGAKSKFLMSDSVKCMRTSTGSAVCVNVDPFKNYDESDRPVQGFKNKYLQYEMSKVSSIVPAFGITDAVRSGEKCYALKNNSLVDSVAENMHIPRDLITDRVLLCGADTSAAMRAPIDAVKEVASLSSDIRGLLNPPGNGSMPSVKPLSPMEITLHGKLR